MKLYLKQNKMIEIETERQDREKREREERQNEWKEGRFGLKRWLSS